MIPSLPPTLDTLTIIPAPRDSILGRTARVSPHRREEVDPHDGFNLVGIQRSDDSAFRNRRVVDQYIDATERIPRLRASGPTAALSARSATHIVDSGEAIWQSASTSASRSRRRAIRPTTAPCSASRAGQGGAHTGRGAGDEHPLARRRERHGSRLTANVDL